MRKTQALILCSAAMFAFNAFGQTPPPPPAGAQAPKDFATEKANILDHLQKMTSCVTAAQSKADLKTCHEQNRPPHPPHGGDGKAGPQG